MPIKQEKLSYTRRDLPAIDEGITGYLQDFIPRIKNITKANSGRQFLALTAGIVDNLNYSVDRIHLETLIRKAQLRSSIIDLSYALGYIPYACSASSVDLTFTMLTGVGPQAIPIYTLLQTIGSPVQDFITIEAANILAGETSVTGVGAIQGVRVVGEVLTAAASGNQKQAYTLSNAFTPHNLVEVSVNAVAWTKVDDFSESDYNDRHFVLSFDEDDFTTITFSDGEFGAIPSAGATITATYFYTTTENVGKDLVTRILGALASTVSVTNPLASSGGGESESDDSIKINAPAFRASDKRVVTKADAVSHAKTVTGVYDAFGIVSGSTISVYIMPVGGGVASSYLLGLVQTALDNLKIEGSTIVVYALAAANLYIVANVVTYDSKIEKSIVRSKVKKAITDELVYTELRIGRGFTLSDTSGFIEDIDDRGLVDYVDLAVHTRIPRVQKSNALAPDIVGRVEIGSVVEYDTYIVTATTTTQFIVSKNGIVQSVTGTVAVEYTTNNSECVFTLGVTGDTFTVGNTWRWYTSKYKDNMYLLSDEFLQLDLDSDLQINVYYPDEYSIIG